MEKIVGGLNLELLQAAGEEAGVDVGQMILDVATGAQKFDAQEAWDRLVDELAGQLRAAVRLTALMVVPALLSAIARQFCGGARASSAVSQVAYLVCAANLAAWFVRLTAQAREMIARVAALADAVFPVLAALLSLSGATASAAAVTPLSALAGNAFGRPAQRRGAFPVRDRRGAGNRRAPEPPAAAGEDVFAVPGGVKLARGRVDDGLFGAVGGQGAVELGL